jgi:type VI secretion system protein ImpL
MLEKFQAARRIRDLFFRPGTPAPDIRFTVNTAGIGPSIPQFVLEIDGQYFDSKAPRQTQLAVWPGPTPGRASARIAARDGAVTKDDQLGAWGFFKLFDRHAQPITDTRFVLGFDVGGEEARVVIDAERVDNPFAKREWQRFTCGQ